ncbi:hypothetical protein Q3O59_14120 [Alkalimonas delamerensis]|uniref:Uncharacterized protein n=1 Tax=Alkalimonas delamerensis TaxID=265981 RepID=A0ABT9GT55_9GAMM|nr:hypothetical protein [Alkalimonas delamerensis]MDP4530161.1 hypothetical protein [Alkalimonas delamerensis]
MKPVINKCMPILSYGCWLLLCLALQQGLIALLNTMVPLGWYLPL